jgi:hypothetical protein
VSGTIQRARLVKQRIMTYPLLDGDQAKDRELFVYGKYLAVLEEGRGF